MVPPQAFLVPGFFSFLLLLLGGGKLLGTARNQRRRKRIKQTPTCPVSRAPGGSRVEIYGQLTASEQGLIVAPFSGRQAVYIRVVVDEYRQQGKHGYWATIVNESDARDFFVDDGSGEPARVYVQGASFELNAQLVAKSGTFSNAPQHLEQFLKSRGKASTGIFGFNKSMRYSEEVLVPGDSLYALGPSRRDAGPSTGSAFRTSQSSQLALFAHQGEENELLLTNLSEAQLLAKLNHGFVKSLVLLAIGGVIGLFALTMLVATFFD